jgi:hypothetical protein
MSRFPAICTSALSNLGDAMLLGASGGDNEVRLGVASKIVVVVAWFGSRRRAEVRLEAMVSTTQLEKIPPTWWRSGCGVWQRKERGCRRRGVDKGLGHGAVSMHRTARGDAVFGLVSSKTTSDRGAAVYRFGRAGLTGHGPLLSLGRLVPPQPFSYFFRGTIFLFLF